MINNKSTKYQNIHKWIRKHFGYANKCENQKCNKVSNNFDWALKKGKKYQYKIENYIMFCRSCHLKYDMTQKRKMKIKLSLFGRKHTIKTRILMSKIAKEKNRVPPPKTQAQLNELKNRMINNTFGFKKGHIPWSKGKHPEYVQKENHPMWKGGRPKCLDCGKQLKFYGPKRCISCEYKRRANNNQNVGDKFF